MKLLLVLVSAGLSVAIPTGLVDGGADVKARQWTGGYSGGYPGGSTGGYGGGSTGSNPGGSTGGYSGSYGASSDTRNDLENGSSSNCPKVIFICARGSTEQGNMGASVCPDVANGLTRKYGSELWVQGVGGAYGATIPDNAQPKGTSQASIDEATRMFTMANTKCPQAAVVAGGYSQGTAVVGNAAGGLAQAVQDQVRGVVLFGYTKNQQNKGGIPGFPADKTKVYCNQGDDVCTGSLQVTAAHLEYGPAASNDAPQWLIEKIGSV